MALLAVMAGTLALSAGVAAAETIKHKGSVKGQKKAKVTFKVTKSDDGLLTEVRSFKVKKLQLKCRRGSVRTTYTLGGSLPLTGDDLARKGKFTFAENSITRGSALKGTVKNGGRKASGKLSVNGLFRTPSGLERCGATVRFKTKKR